MRSYKGRGVVLHTLKYGDNALIVHLLTDVGGRESFIVQGAGKGRARGSRAALFQPLFALEFEGIAPARGELHRFREVRSGITLRRTPFDFKRSTISLFIAEVLYRLVTEREPNEALFQFVWASVEALDTIDEGVANFHLWFLANLSRYLGFMPSTNYSEGRWFDICEGAFCATQPSHSLFLTPPQARLLHDMVVCDIDAIATLALNHATRVEFLESLLRYYGYHLDGIRAVHSVEIFRGIFL